MDIKFCEKSQNEVPKLATKCQRITSLSNLWDFLVDLCISALKCNFRMSFELETWITREIEKHCVK